MLTKDRKSSRNLCFYVEQGDYNIDGENISTSKLQAVNLDNQLKNEDTIGIIPVTHNLRKSDNLNFGDFKTLPGAYAIQFKSAVGKGNKGRVLIPENINFAGIINIPKDRDGEILILGANYYKLKSTQGIKIFYIDPQVEGRESDDVKSKGIPVIEEWIENRKLEMIEKAPGWYRAITGSKRTQNGEEKEVIIGLEFIREFNINEALVKTETEEEA
jgi:hypothetical protein